MLFNSIAAALDAQTESPPRDARAPKGSYLQLFHNVNNGDAMLSPYLCEILKPAIKRRKRQSHGYPFLGIIWSILERPDMTTKWHTIEEVAEFLQISREKIYKLCQKGKMPASKVGGQWRFDLKEVDLWVRKQRPAKLKK